LFFKAGENVHFTLTENKFTMEHPDRLLRMRPTHQAWNVMISTLLDSSCAVLSFLDPEFGEKLTE